MHPYEAELLAFDLGLKHRTMCCAESCTGGLIGAAMTDLPGSSEYFLGSAVTYSNEAKMRLLGVREQTLIDHGAVSEDRRAGRGDRHQACRPGLHRRVRRLPRGGD